MEGVKHDGEKDRWDLLPWGEVRDVVKVLTFGAGKYKDNNWQKVSNGERRYFSAAMRHITARELGERIDPESGLPHLAHAICCLLFWLWLDKSKSVANRFFNV